MDRRPKKKRRRQLTVHKHDESGISLENLRDILLHIYSKESVILGIMLAEAAIRQKNMPAHRKALKLLDLAMNPPGSASKRVLEEIFTTILTKLPSEDILSIINFVTDVILENEQNTLTMSNDKIFKKNKRN